MPGKVLVTGGNGYIAGFLIRQLIAEGWQVNATIRDPDAKGSLRDALDASESSLRFFAADLMQDAGWAEALAGCSHVAHLASPLPSGVPENEEEVITPARDGALRVLRLARDAGMRRFVLASSIGAIGYGRPKGDYHFTEADWTNTAHSDTHAYVNSKTISERVARDWAAENGGPMEFCSVNPSVVLGPILGGRMSASIEAVRRIMAGLPGCPRIGFEFVDVRDVADCFVRALTLPGLNGERFIASAVWLDLIDIARILKERLDERASTVNVREMPDAVMEWFAGFDPVAMQLVMELGRTRRMDSSHARSVLDWQTRPIELTIEETAESMLEHGLV